MVLVDEVGKMISEEYNECACRRALLSEVVELCDGVLFKNT